VSVHRLTLSPPTYTHRLLWSTQGSARVIRCLQSQRDTLSSTCRATLFDEEVKFSENIDFQFPMKKACAKEMQQWCAKVPHGNARVIRWVMGGVGVGGCVCAGEDS
jgi:hypothetical protein